MTGLFSWRTREDASQRSLGGAAPALASRSLTVEIGGLVRWLSFFCTRISSVLLGFYLFSNSLQMELIYDLILSILKLIIYSMIHFEFHSFNSPCDIWYSHIVRWWMEMKNRITSKKKMIKITIILEELHVKITQAVGRGDETGSGIIMHPVSGEAQSLSLPQRSPRPLSPFPAYCTCTVNHRNIKTKEKNKLSLSLFLESQ